MNFTTGNREHIAEIRHFHLFAGLGGGARGFNRGNARVGNLKAQFRCIGGVDVDAAAIADFERLVGVPGTVMDLASRDQYVGIHGHEPPEDWREATTTDIHRAAGWERPHIVFLSAPCKGFSGLLSEERSRSDKYQALNHLTVRGVLLMLEAWRDDPPEMVLFENVPRIANRGRPLLDTIVGLLQAYGYAVAETTHDCGELGGLAQSRKRFLLVARHIEKVPPFLYEPRSKPLRGVGEVIGRLPLPVGDPINPMHRLPSLQWRTWVRLAFVEAGKDWRSLQRLAVEDGFLRDYRLAAEADWNGGVLGVRNWDQPSATVTGRSAPTTGAYAVADPRIDGHPASVQHGVKRWDQTAGVVTGKMFIGGGPHAVADPRIEGVRHNTTFRVVRWPDAAPAVTGPGGPGGLSVADPRAAPGWAKYPMTEWDGAAGSVIGASTTGQGAFAVAVPRPTVDPSRRSAYLSAGHYGVVPWDSPSGGVTGSLQHDSGRGNVADPRLPEVSDQLQCMIIAEDNTWHRPFTTLELAALQSLLDLDEYQHFELHGRSDSSYRERIGNAVPSDAAAAIASEMGRTLLLAWSGETFILDSAPIWVRPVIAAIQCGVTGGVRR